MTFFQKFVLCFIVDFANCLATPVFLDAANDQEIEKSTYVQSLTSKINLSTNPCSTQKFEKFENFLKHAKDNAYKAPQQTWRQKLNQYRYYDQATEITKRSRSLSDLDFPCQKKRRLNVEPSLSENQHLTSTLRTSNSKALIKNPFAAFAPFEILTQEPVTAPMSPEILTQEPVTALMSPEILTQEPVTALMSPEILTQEPVTALMSPEILTQEPVTAPMSPEILTQESVGFSASPEVLTPDILDSIELLKNKYDAFIIDIVGIIHDGINPFEKTIQFINELISENKTVVLVSNTSRPYTQPAQTLATMGLNQGVSIVTAGDHVREVLIKEYQDQKIYHLGAERNQEILKDLDISSTPTFEHANVILLTQYVDEGESLSQFDALLKNIAARKLIVLCANSDKTASVGDKLRHCAGILAARIEEFQETEGTVRYYGKPDLKLFEKILDDIPHIKEIPKDRILIIGDTLEKDIKWGINSGVDSLLVLTGTTGRDLEKTGKKTNEALKQLCKHEKIRPTYYTNSLS